MTHAALKDLLDKYDHIRDHVGGCSDGGCVVKRPVGMHTNGGCKCSTDKFKAQRMMYAGQKLRDELSAALSAMEGEAVADAIVTVDASQVSGLGSDNPRFYQTVEVLRAELRPGTKLYTAPPPQQADKDLMQRTVDKVVAKVMGQREEILQAFVAKYGFQPDEAVQVIGHDGSWRVIRREEMSHPTPSPGPQGGWRNFSEEIGANGEATGYLLFDSTPPAHQPEEVVTDAMVERGLQAAIEASGARLPRYSVVRQIITAALSTTPTSGGEHG